MHALAPLPILLGLICVGVGIFWVVGALSGDDGGELSTPMLWIFGLYYLALRFCRELARDPGGTLAGVLPGAAFVAGGVGLVWLGAVMW